MVEKISNRGFRHKRIVVVTSTYVVFAKEDGEIRKWFEISAVDNIFMQEAGGGCKRVLLRLESSNEEPDVVFASREKEDQRNSHATTGEFLKVLEYIHRARNPDRRNVINIQVLNSDVDMKHMIRQNIEKQDVRERRRTLAASTGAPPNMSFGGLSKASRSAAALHKQIAKDEDSDPDDPKLAALPKWKPDSSVKACEECCKYVDIFLFFLQGDCKWKKIETSNISAPFGSAQNLPKACCTQKKNIVMFTYNLFPQKLYVDPKEASLPCLWRRLLCVVHDDEVGNREVGYVSWRGELK